MLGNRGGHAHPAPAQPEGHCWKGRPRSLALREEPPNAQAPRLGPPPGRSYSLRRQGWETPRKRASSPGPVLSTGTPNPQPSPETHLSGAQRGRPNCGSGRVGSCPRCCHSEAGAGRGAAHPYSGRTIGGGAGPALNLRSDWLDLPRASLQDGASPWAHPFSIPESFSTSEDTQVNLEKSDFFTNIISYFNEWPTSTFHTQTHPNPVRGISLGKLSNSQGVGRS